MTAQKFELVFQKISLSLPLLEAFQGTEVRKLTIHKKERTVSIEIAANKMIPLQKQEELKGALLESLPGIQAVFHQAAEDNHRRLLRRVPVLRGHCQYSKPHRPSHMKQGQVCWKLWLCM